MKNKIKVLVTGSSGFLGRHIVDSIISKGYDVVTFDLVEFDDHKKSTNFHCGDLLDYNSIDKAIKGCDFVYHFAGQADIGLSSNIPSKTIMANNIGTQNVLEAARKHNVKRFLFASTIYVYSELGSFYRASKQSCEIIIEEYQREFNLDYTILRFGSLYGPGANEFNGVRDFLIQALKNKKIIRRGDGEEIREYIHVKDAAGLSLDALDNKFKNKHLIITGNEQIKVKDLLIMIKEIFNGDIEIKFGGEEDLHHYEITPYNYKPQIAKKITPDSFYDLGQGLLDQIYDLEKSLDEEFESKKIGLRKRKK